MKRVCREDLEYVVNYKIPSYLIGHSLHFIAFLTCSSTKLFAEVCRDNKVFKKPGLLPFSFFFLLTYLPEPKGLMSLQFEHLVQIQMCDIVYVSSSRLCYTRMGRA